MPEACFDNIFNLSLFLFILHAYKLPLDSFPWWYGYDIDEEKRKSYEELCRNNLNKQTTNQQSWFWTNIYKAISTSENLKTIHSFPKHSKQETKWTFCFHVVRIATMAENLILHSVPPASEI